MALFDIHHVKHIIDSTALKELKTQQSHNKYGSRSNKVDLYNPIDYV